MIVLAYALSAANLLAAARFKLPKTSPPITASESEDLPEDVVQRFERIMAAESDFQCLSPQTAAHVH